MKIIMINGHLLNLRKYSNLKEISFIFVASRRNTKG